MRHTDSSACYNRLCAIEGAIQGIRWHNLSDEIKNELKQFYNQWK
ncbi:MAG: TfoX/Sxy family protein [Treponema sp.]|nr:TfoX/Sxy family protein [Treponema sp.]